MNKFVLALSVCGLMLLLAFAAPVSAADQAQAQAQRQLDQPYNNAPVWREVRSGEAQYTSVRGVDTGVLIQSGGETWRQLRNGPIIFYGGVVLCVVAVAIGLFYWLRGQIKLHEQPTGRKLQRFNAVERMAHWSMAISFCVLGLTGLVTLFGKHILLPLFGYGLFSWVAQLSKTIHNFVGPLFLVSIVVFFFMFVKDNIWQNVDAEWIKKAGGLFSGAHVASHRFNFGEKTWFWISVFFLGLAVGITGLVLDFPNFGQGRGVMQIASIIHVVGALVVMAFSLGHIYVGTIGIEGAYDSMRYGHVDETWAKEHHEYWYDEVKRQPQQPDKQPAHPAGAAVQSS